MQFPKPTEMLIEEGFSDRDKKLVAELNGALLRLEGLRAVQINVSGHFLRSKIAWKLATYQHALLHRLIALMDGVGVTWNAKSTLACILAARAVMETFAIFAELEIQSRKLLAAEDLGGIDALAQNGVFATRDPNLIAEAPEIQAKNIIGYIDKFDKRVQGFRRHYDELSERCHPNASGHNFMFGKLDRTDGTVNYAAEQNPERNRQLILAALAIFPLAESLMAKIDKSILEMPNCTIGFRRPAEIPSNSPEVLSRSAVRRNARHRPTRGVGEDPFCTSSCAEERGYAPCRLSWP